MLLNFTIDTWFGTTVAPPFHLMAQSSRAAELGIPFIRAALTGISAVVGPDGVVQKASGVNVQETLVTTVHLPNVTTPYRAVGPIFRWVVVLLTLWGLIAVWRSRRQRLETMDNHSQFPSEDASKEVTERQSDIADVTKSDP